MRVRHPYSLDEDSPEPDGRVHWGGRRRISEVDEDGIFEVPDNQTRWLEEWAARYGYEPEDLLVYEDTDESDGGDDTCTAVKSDGEVCGRDLPCRYHSEEDE